MSTDDIIVADSSPYPELRVQHENPRFGQKLCNAFGGPDGEFSAISGYVYQSIIFKEKFPVQSDILLRIAIVEMKHLAMVGRLVDMLGAEVIFGHYPCGEPVYWNGVGVNYMNDIASALIHDLNSEQKAYAEYISLARQSGDRYVFAVLSRIALDEMVHTSLLKSLISDITKID